MSCFQFLLSQLGLDYNQRIRTETEEAKGICSSHVARGLGRRNFSLSPFLVKIYTEPKKSPAMTTFQEYLKKRQESIFNSRYCNNFVKYLQYVLIHAIQS